MKIDNRGFGIQSMMIAVLVLMMCLVLISAFANKVFNNISNEETNSTDYIEIEEKVEQATKKYQQKYYNNILDGDEIKVSLKSLQNEGFIDILKDNKNNICDGYAYIIGKENKVIYNAYIRCGNELKQKVLKIKIKK